MRETRLRFQELRDRGILDFGDGYRAKNAELQGEGPVFLRAAYLQDEGFILNQPDRFKEVSVDKFGRKVAQIGDVVITTKGNSTGRIGVVREKEAGSIYSPHLSYWRSLSPTFLDQRYLYFWSMSVDFEKQLHSLAYATDMAPYLSLRDQATLIIPVPPIKQQRAIASVLGALDDKIELNRQTNETLEAMARALFKDWFVDFGPTRAKAEGRPPYLAPDLWELFPDALDDEDKPVGWAEASIYELSEVVYGAPFASKQFNSENIGLPLIRIRDLATHSPGVSTDQVHKKGHMIEPGDIVVGMDGEFRLHVWKGPKAWLNQRVCHFEPKLGIPRSFLAEALKEPLAFFERGKVGTTVIHLGKSDIDTFKLIHPGGAILSTYATIAEPLLQKTVANALESRTLAQTRDFLLPKLMSGEINLRDAENAVEAVA